MHQAVSGAAKPTVINGQGGHVVKCIDRVISSTSMDGRKCCNRLRVEGRQDVVARSPHVAICVGSCAA
jgi:hypothetical protein